MRPELPHHPAPIPEKTACQKTHQSFRNVKPQISPVGRFWCVEITGPKPPSAVADGPVLECPLFWSKICAQPSVMADGGLIRVGDLQPGSSSYDPPVP